MNKNEFENKKVLVTGSSRGIGFQIGQSFLLNGSNVIFTGKTPTKNFEKTDKSYYFSCDLTNEVEIQKLYDFTSNVFEDNLDFLICNLGGGKAPVDISYPQTEWQKMFNLNFFSTVYTIQKFLNFLKKSKNPSIVCISSICGHAAIGCPITYSTAKSALNTYVKNISKLIAKDNIRINSISPGNIIFPGSTWDEKIQNDKSKTTQYIKANVPLQKFGQVQNITEMVLFLSSEMSNFTTGSNFVIDGGQSNV